MDDASGAAGRGAGNLRGTFLAEVVSVSDPDSLNRVQVRLHGFDGVDDYDAPMWARVAVPFAGRERGAFFIPDVGDEVLVTFVQGDPRMPVVVGSLWNGRDAAPDSFSGDRVDRWVVVGKAGTRIAIVEESASTAKIELVTPNGVKGTLTDEGGGRIQFEAAGSKITIDTSGVSIETPSTVKVQASRVNVTAAQVSVDAAMSTFSGMVKCDVLKATTVIATTYTPGAGNVW